MRPWRGWISCRPEHRDRWRQRLEELGVRVGPWNQSDVVFDSCEVADVAVLDPFWGELYWGTVD